MTKQMKGLVFFLVTGVLLGAAPKVALSQGLSGQVIGAKQDDKPKFGGFGFDFTLADSMGLNAVGHNYRNDLSFYLEPHWNVGARFMPKLPVLKRLVISARFIVTQNLAGTDEGNFNGTANSGPQGTCSNLTPSTNGGTIDPTKVGYCNPAQNDRRTDYNDLWVNFALPGFYKIPKIDVRLNGVVRLVFPTSMQSRFETLRTGLTFQLGAGRSFWKGRIRLGYTFGFTKNFHGSTTAGQTPDDPNEARAQGGNYYDGATGTTISNLYSDPTRLGATGRVNTSYSIINIISGGVQFHEKVGMNILYIPVDGWTYGQTCNQTINGLEIDTCATGDQVAAASGSTTNRPGHRPSQVFWASLDYQPLPYLGFSLAWITWSGRQKPDGSYRQGLISTDYNAFTSVMLSSTLSIDGLLGKWL